MPIDPTGGISQLMEILRRQASGAEQSQAVAKSGVPAQNAKTSEKDRARDPKLLQKKIAARIKTLPLDSEKEFRVAVKLFVEDVLLFEFGEELGQDPQFYEMLDTLSASISQDQNLSGEFKTLFHSMAAS